METRVSVTNELLEAKLEAIYVRFDSMDKAIKLYRQEMEAKTEHLNSLRAEVLTDRHRFITTDVFLAKMERLEQLRYQFWLSLFSVLLSASTALYVALAWR